MSHLDRLGLVGRRLLGPFGALLLAGLLGLSAGSAQALIRSLATASRTVSQTGVVTVPGGGGTAPALATPAHVRTLSRALCAGARLPAACNAHDGSSVVEIGWYDVSTDDVSSFLERRREPDGAWELRQRVDAPIAYQMSLTDTGLLPDTRYCYRVTVVGRTGTRLVSIPTCVVTQQVDDLAVTRAQLRVVIADVADAGTDGFVSLALTDPFPNLPTGNFTSLDTPRDDLERGSDVVYELNVRGVDTLRDVTRISLASGSTDEFCVERMQLILNDNENDGLTPASGTVVFDRFFGAAASRCRWVGGIHGPLVIAHGELRAAPGFNAFDGGAAITAIGRSEVQARLEALFGTMLFQRFDVFWGSHESEPVAIEASGDSLEVEVDLEAEVEGPNPDLLVRFTLKPSFTPTDVPNVWNFHLATQGLSTTTEYGWLVARLASILDPVCIAVENVAAGSWPPSQHDRCIEELQDYIASSLDVSFDDPATSTVISMPAGCTLPVARVDADAGIHFECEAFGGTGPTIDPTRIDPSTTLQRF
ncbi:MAG: hypothetical protein R3F35_05070 [Myxococcota bacterium]